MGRFSQVRQTAVWFFAKRRAVWLDHHSPSFQFSSWRGHDENGKKAVFGYLPASKRSSPSGKSSCEGRNFFTAVAERTGAIVVHNFWRAPRRAMHVASNTEIVLCRRCGGSWVFFKITSQHRGGGTSSRKAIRRLPNFNFRSIGVGERPGNKRIPQIIYRELDLIRWMSSSVPQRRTPSHNIRVP